MPTRHAAMTAPIPASASLSVVTPEAPKKRLIRDTVSDRRQVTAHQPFWQNARAVTSNTALRVAQQACRLVGRAEGAHVVACARKPSVTAHAALAECNRPLRDRRNRMTIIRPFTPPDEPERQFAQ